MHIDILSDSQKSLLDLLSLFKREYYLVGGTAIALQIGHRQSIDFDLFKEKKIRKSDVFSPHFSFKEIFYPSKRIRNTKIFVPQIQVFLNRD